MAKIVNRKVSIGIELNQEEIDALFNLLDMFYNEANYKRWAHRLSQLRQEICPYVNDITTKNKYPKHEDPPF